MNDYWRDFERYVEKAVRLQEMNISPLGPRDVRVDPGFEDPLMQYVTIYDVVERKYAGFSNAEQQLWCGSRNPKHWQARPDFDRLQSEWPLETWLTVFLLHRATGSGASFAADHGFRNSILAEFGDHCQTPDEVVRYWLDQAATGRALFTSIGNQPPPFPKPPSAWPRASDAYVGLHAENLVLDVATWLDGGGYGQRQGIESVVDFANEWNRAHGIKRFNFVYTAWAMDMAEYFPHLVDPTSHVNYGKNALESMALIAPGQRPELVMDQMIHVFSSKWPDLTWYPMSLEDVLCDYIRFVECFVPAGYDHLQPWQVQNRSIANHPVRHRSYHKHLAKYEITSIFGVSA